MIIILLFNTNTRPKTLTMIRAFTQIKGIIEKMEAIQFVHILREHNKEANAMGNLVVILMEG